MATATGYIKAGLTTLRREWVEGEKGSAGAFDSALEEYHATQWYNRDEAERARIGLATALEHADTAADAIFEVARLLEERGIELDGAALEKMITARSAALAANNALRRLAGVEV